MKQINLIFTNWRHRTSLHVNSHEVKKTVRAIFYWLSLAVRLIELSHARTPPGCVSLAKKIFLSVPWPKPSSMIPNITALPPPALQGALAASFRLHTVYTSSGGMLLLTSLSSLSWGCLDAGSSRSNFRHASVIDAAAEATKNMVMIHDDGSSKVLPMLIHAT
jgi:hypothetical protein